METQPVYYTTKVLFAKLETCRSFEELTNFVRASNLTEQLESFYDKYPAFDFALTPNDVKHLRETEVITSCHTLNPDKFPADPLAKLLAAVLLKNGDIKKVQHVFDGIIGEPKDRSDYSLIFKQYGASLANDAEPIVDQHVLRAFEIYCLECYSEAAVNKSRSKSIFKTVDRPLLNKYRDWFTHLLSNVPLSERDCYRETLDKIIFIHGKTLRN